MAKNPLMWPGFEQLGRDFYDRLKPALDQLAAGNEQLDDEAQLGLKQLETWLAAPCVATVKLDGTNMGIDNTGLLVGRNIVVEPGASYQKVDVATLLKDYPGKVELFRCEMESATGEAIPQAMLYGELLMNGKFNYAKAGIFKDWLCFGAVLRPSAEEAVARLASQLRAAGYNATPCEGLVRVTPNTKLAAFLTSMGVRSVHSVYCPAGVTEAQWAEHDAPGSLPCFTSLRRLLESEWARRVLLPTDGIPVCEGLVVASEADGQLFKWKNGGEELGKVPEQLGEAVRQLRELAGSHRIGLLPDGLLGICELLLVVATTKPAVQQAAARPARAKEEDTEALAVWDSALTKFDSLEEVFGRGVEAKAAREQDLIEQITKDLVKDYGAKQKMALQRATKVVKTQVGIRFGAWKKTQSESQSSVA